MAKKRIEHDDLIAPNIFEQDKRQAEELLQELVKLNQGFKDLAQTTGAKIRAINPKDISDIHQLNTESEKMNNIYKGNNEIKKQSLLVEEKLRQARQRAKSDMKDEVTLMNAQKGSITAMRAELSKVTKDYNDLSEEERNNHAIGGKLAEQKLELTEKLKKLEGATGDHRREVGNYANATKGLTAILIAAGEAMGIDKEWVEKLKEAHGELRHAIHGTHEMMHNLGSEHEKEAHAAKEGAKAAEGMKMAQLGTIPIIGIVIASLVLLGAAIYAVILNTEAEEEAEKARSQAVDGSIIKNKELRDAYNEHIIAIKTLSNEYRVMRGEMTRTEATIDNIKTKTLVAVKNINNETKKEIEEAKSLWNVAKDFIFNYATGGSAGAAVSYAKRVGGVIQEGNEKVKAEITKAGDEIRNLKLENDKRDIEDRLRFIEQSVRLEELRGTLTLDKEIKYLEKERAVAIQLAHMKGESELLVAREYEIKRLQVIEEHYKKEIEKINEVIKKAGEKYKEDAEAFKKMFEQKQKDADAFYKKQIELMMNNEIKEAQLEERKAKTSKQKYKAETDLENAEYQKRVDDLANMYDSEQKKTQAYHKAQELLKKEHEENLKKIEEEKRRERLEAELAIQEKALDYLSQSLQKQAELERRAIDYKMGLIDASIQEQAALAAAGHKNILDHEIAQKAKAIEEQKALEQKEHRRQEALQLANIYLEFMKVYAKDGQAAAAKALAQTLLARGISAGIAGAFAEGVEGIKGPGTDTSDNLIAWLSPGESVITAKGTRENPGLATAVNDGTVDEYFQRIYMPQMDVLTRRVGTRNIMESFTDVIHNDIASLEETIKNKKETWIDRDVLTQLLRIVEKENGVQKNYVQYDYPIVRRNGTRI